MTAGSVTVEVFGRDVNLVALLGQLEGRLKTTDQAGIKLASTTGGTFTQAQQRAANAAITEAQALARAAVAAGDDARAHSILVNALGQSAAASDRSVASLTTSINRLQSGSTAAQQFGSAVKSNLLSIVGPAAAATAAFAALRSAAASLREGLELKASLDSTTASINAQLKGVRDTGQVYAEAASFARQYKLTQQETTEAISASIGVMRSSKAPVEDILGVLARMQVLSPEQSLQEAAIALKALASGDTTSLVTRFEVGRDVATQMKNEIQGGSDAVQVMSRFLGDTGIGMDTLKAKTEGATGAMKDLKIAQEEVLLAQGRLAEKGIGFVRVQADATNLLAESISGNLAPSFEALGNTVTTSLGGSFAVGGEQIKQMTGDAFGLGSALQTMGIDSIAYGQSARFAADSTTAQLGATQQLISAGQPLVSGMQAQIEAALAAGQAAQFEAAQLRDSSEAAQLDAAAKAADAAQTALMTAENQKLVDAFLALNPNISASGAAAAATSAGYSPLIARLIELAVITREARGELAALNALANISVPASQRVTDREFDTPADRAEVKSNQALDANRALLARIASDNAKAAAGGRAAGASAGAAKLSDQTKLNNTLLSDQEKYQDQAEQAERQHQEKLLDITREAAKRQLAQQKKNEIDKRESELGFLESITASELNATEEGRAAIQAINERYYADFDAAQKAAQAGNAAQSEAMVAAAGERAAAEQRYAEQIEQARQNDNDAEITRLEALREKQRQILDEKDKQITEGGDANVNQTNEALTAEQARYEEQTGKIGTAAESAAERKVNAAVRSGKAVADETALLLEQETILNRMGRTAAPGVAEGGSTAAPSTAAATTPPPGTPDPNAGILGVLESIASAVREAKDAITREQGNTTSAVKGLGPRLVN